MLIQRNFEILLLSFTYDIGLNISELKFGWLENNLGINQIVYGFGGGGGVHDPDIFSVLKI